MILDWRKPVMLKLLTVESRFGRFWTAGDGPTFPTIGDVSYVKICDNNNSSNVINSGLKGRTK